MYYIAVLAVYSISNLSGLKEEKMLQFCNIFSDKKVMLFLKAYHFDRVNVRKYENFLDCIFDWLYQLNFNNF